MKSMLTDKETIAMISVACPQSQMMERGVYLFENLEDRASNEELKFVTCLAILKPTAANLALFKDELTRPRFGRYHVYMTQPLSRTLIKDLAESDWHEVVVTINETFLSFCPLESHVFSVHAKWETFLKNGSSPVQSVDSLFSLLTTLRIRPQICYSKSSPDCRSFVDQLEFKLSESAFGGNRNAVVMIVDRRADVVTPVLNQWTYQVRPLFVSRSSFFSGSHTHIFLGLLFR